MKTNKVFLGGSCFGEDWRAQLIPLIQIAHFNPLVDDWTADCKMIEDAEKNVVCNIHLYVITSPKSIYSIAEAVQSSMTNGKSTILHVIPKGFKKQELKHMTEICNLVKDNGAIVYIDEELARTARVINFAFKTTDFN